MLIAMQTPEDFERSLQHYQTLKPPASLIMAADQLLVLEKHLSNPTAAMIDAGAQRLVGFGDNRVWPDSWTPLEVAAARNEAERVWRSMVEVLNSLPPNA